jgi:hypothetical protein
VTYCIGVMLDKGMIFASDSRTLYSGGNPRRLPRKPGRARIRDQRIIDPYVWTVPVVCCLLLCHKVVGRSALRPEPDNSGPFRIIGVE